MIYRNAIRIAGAVALIGQAEPAAARSSVGDSPFPVTVVSGEDFEAGSTSSIADTLANLPTVSFGSGQQLSFNPATSQVNLRGLGDNRTLVLVNGRRTAPDAYSFPNTVLDRLEAIDVCRGGATAVYGSDAVAGVVNFILQSDDETRSVLAGETAGQLVSGVVDFNYRPSGYEYGAELDFCLPSQRILPSTLGFSLSAFQMTADASVGGLNFSNGLGVPGIGGQAGVFVNSPTDLIEARFDSDRRGFHFGLDLTVPLNATVRAPRPGNLGVNRPDSLRNNRRPSLDRTNLIVGLNFGGLEQSEATWFEADTPAFGLNSRWQGDYHTNFDGQFVGGHVGVGLSRTYFGRGNTSTTVSLSGTVGYNAFDFDVREAVMANGLGGALNYSNTGDYSFSEGLFTSSITAGVDFRQDNWTWGAFISADSGQLPEIHRFLPDSDASGPLNPQYSLEPAFLIRGGLFARLIF